MISVIIVSWNTRELTVACIRSIFSYWHDILFEIIVVDNDSSDGSAEAIEKTFPDVVLIRSGSNLGFVGGNNLGYQQSTGELVLLLNSDTLVISDSVKDLIERFCADENLGAVTGKVLNADGSFQRPFRRFPSLLGAYFRHSWRLIRGFDTPFHRRFLMKDHGPDKACEVDWISGAYLFVKRKFLEWEYLLQPEIFMYYEDTLLCHEVRKKGGTVMYIPAGDIIHYGGESSKQVSAFASWHSLCSSYIYFKHAKSHSVARLYRMSVVFTWKIFAMSFSLMALTGSVLAKRKRDLFCEMLKFDRARVK